MSSHPVRLPLGCSGPAETTAAQWPLVRRSTRRSPVATCRKRCHRESVGPSARSSPTPTEPVDSSRSTRKRTSRRPARSCSTTPRRPADGFRCSGWAARAQAAKRLPGGGFARPCPPCSPTQADGTCNERFAMASQTCCHPSTGGDRPCGSPTSRWWTGSTPRMCGGSNGSAGRSSAGDLSLSALVPHLPVLDPSAVGACPATAARSGRSGPQMRGSAVPSRIGSAKSRQEAMVVDALGRLVLELLLGSPGRPSDPATAPYPSSTVRSGASVASRYSATSRVEATS